MQTLDQAAAPGAIDQGPSPLYTPDQLRRLRRIVSRTPYYTDDATFLRITVNNGFTGITVDVHWRQATLDGTVKPGRVQLAPNATHTTVTTDILIGEGLLYNVTALATGGAPLVGQTFVQVQLILGSGAAAYILGTLIGNFVTSTQGLAWPGSPIVLSTSGEPLIRQIVGTAPAAGATSTETVPAGVRWELVLYWIELSAQVGTINGQNPFLNVFSAAANVIMEVPPINPFNSTAVVGDAQWFQGYSAPAAQTQFLASSFPTGVKLLAGSQLKVNGITNMTWTAPRYTVREWPEVT